MSASGRARSANLLVVLALVTIAGCTTIALQLVAERNEPRHAGGAMRAEFAPEVSAGIAPLALHHTSSASGDGADTEHHPYRDVDRFQRRPLVDRRFAGQVTGRVPQPEEEVPYRPPALRDGPFGWGTDWIAGVGLPGPGRGNAEDIIEPAWCQASVENRSFVENVMERRVNGPVNTSNRVVSCTRTKDRGRYLPEWVAYHWALGVDEFDIFDDDSVDDTREVLEPFVRAGIVKFQPHRIRRNVSAEHDNASAVMAPIKECVERYREMHVKGDASAPRWLALVDTDEYLWAADVATAGGLPELLDTHSTTCCLQVSTVQHGTSRFSKTPRGLLLENFLTHADPASAELNGPPKLVVNFNFGPGSSGGASTSSSSGGVAEQHPTLSSVLVGVDPDNPEKTNCRCETAPVAELAVHRFPITREDVDSKEERYSALGQQQQPVEDVGFNVTLETAALNDHKSDGILAWSCVVRHVLSRAANGRHVVTGRRQTGLSPHHPINHGIHAMDPYGEEELERTEACISKLRSSPTVAGSAWGPVDSPPTWLPHACLTRYVFVHSFEDTGELEVVRLLVGHPWVTSHVGETAVAGGGSALTTAIPSARDREGATGVAQKEMCGCTKGDSRGCWRYCPKLQRNLLAPRGINQARRQLVQDWLLRFNLKGEPGKPLVLVERDPDMLLNSKQGLFPFVSTSILTVRHPLCTSPAAAGGAVEEGTDGTSAGLREWREVWQQVLVSQVPRARGAVWVVRFEDLLSQEQEFASALWAAVGLPPISPYTSASASDGNPSNGGQQRRLRRRRLIMGDAMSRTTPAVRNKAFPAACRARLASCENNPACQLELLRSASLLDFFGYGGSGEMLNSQRFLWGKEELQWLGDRLSSEPSEPPPDMLNNERDRAGFDTVDDEPSVVMPQAPHRPDPVRRRKGRGG